MVFIPSAILTNFPKPSRETWVPSDEEFQEAASWWQDYKRAVAAGVHEGDLAHPEDFIALFGRALFFSVAPEYEESDSEEEAGDEEESGYTTWYNPMHFMNYYNPEQHEELLRDNYQT